MPCDICKGYMTDERTVEARLISASATLYRWRRFLLGRIRFGSFFPGWRRGSWSSAHLTLG